MKKRKQKSTQQRRTSKSQKKKFEPRSLKEFFAMPELDREIWKNVGQAVTEMRAGASRRQAAQKFDLDPRMIQQRAPSALRKLRSGRWVARPKDRLLRVLVIPTRKGLREIGVRDSRQSSQLGKYWSAVDRYRDTGDPSVRREFRGKYIVDDSGKRVPLLTDLRELDRLGSAGVLSFESLYAGAT